MTSEFVRLTSTFFYIGNLPMASGTIASLAGALLCVILSPSVVLYLVVLAAVTITGLLVGGPMEDIVKKKDPSCVVIDEISGIMLSFFLLPMKWPVLITAFFLFRALDMFKLYPVEQFENFEGGLGIMMDDIVAGIYTNIIMQIAIRWAGIV